MKKVNILYCDNHLLVLNKPSHMLTQPNGTNDTSLEDEGKKWLKHSFNKQSNIFLHSVHRLDRPVSGIVLFARTSKALPRLNAMMRDHMFEKEYMAVVEGAVIHKEGILENYLKKASFKAHETPDKCEGAKKCLLKFCVLKIRNNYTLLKISLITGRYHQIRAQLSAFGHPVVGDQKYHSSVSSKKLFLHHASLSFPHPITQEKIVCTAPLPLDWNIVD